MGYHNYSTSPLTARKLYVGYHNLSTSRYSRKDLNQKTRYLEWVTTTTQPVHSHMVLCNKTCYLERVTAEAWVTAAVLARIIDNTLGIVTAWPRLTEGQHRLLHGDTTLRVKTTLINRIQHWICTAWLTEGQHRLLHGDTTLGVKTTLINRIQHWICTAWLTEGQHRLLHGDTTLGVKTTLINRIQHWIS